MTDKQQDETIKDRITRLLRKGRTRGQLINDLGFAERTVDAAIKAYKEFEGDNCGEDKEAAASSTRNDALAIRKDKESVLLGDSKWYHNHY